MGESVISNGQTSGLTTYQAGDVSVTSKADRIVADFAVRRYAPAGAGTQLPDPLKEACFTPSWFKGRGIISDADQPGQISMDSFSLIAAVTVSGREVKIIMGAPEEESACLAAVQGQVRKTMRDWSGVIPFDVTQKGSEARKIEFGDPLSAEGKCPEDLLPKLESRLHSPICDIIEHEIGC